MAEEIAQRYREVAARVAAAASRSGRAPDSVRLVLASKTQGADRIRSAYEAGAREFGENYVQEGVAKREALADLEDLTWHLIGHLQSNKARIAAASFDLIHTLDSARLAEALERERPMLPVLIEVNIGAEASKSGVAPDMAEQLIDECRTMVDIAGLMTIPPPHGDPRRHFAAIRALRERLAESTGLALSELSMGMTEDFEVAIEEGATIVRVGRAVFGERAR